MFASVQHILGGRRRRVGRFGGEAVPCGGGGGGGDLGGEPVLFHPFQAHLLVDKLEKLYSRLQVNIPLASLEIIQTNLG